MSLKLNVVRASELQRTILALIRTANVVNVKTTKSFKGDLFWNGKPDEENL